MDGHNLFYIILLLKLFEKNGKTRTGVPISHSNGFAVVVVSELPQFRSQMY
jgi:hypothetical protein